MKSKILCKLLKSGAKFPAMPRIYIDGTYIGGIDELEATADCGDLKKRLNKMPKLQVNSIPTNRISNQWPSDNCLACTVSRSVNWAIVGWNELNSVLYQIRDHCQYCYGAGRICCQVCGGKNKENCTEERVDLIESQAN